MIFKTLSGIYYTILYSKVYHYNCSILYFVLFLSILFYSLLSQCILVLFYSRLFFFVLFISVLLCSILFCSVLFISIFCIPFPSHLLLCSTHLIISISPLFFSMKCCWIFVDEFSLWRVWVSVWSKCTCCSIIIRSCYR